MRTMYDSVTPGTIPADATMVAGYVDGHCANLTAMRARFPHATVVGIAVSSHTNDGQVLDIEKGDATPGEAPAWVTMRRAAHVDPSVYCNSSTWPAVRAAFEGAAVPEPHYWIAEWDGSPTIPAGAVAKQHSNPGPYDISSVASYWPGVDPVPAPAPAPTPTPEPAMPLSQQDAQLVANAVWYTELVNVQNGQQTPAEAFLRYGDYLRQQQTTAILDAIGKLTSLVEQLLPHPAAPAPHAAALEAPQEAPAPVPAADEPHPVEIVAQEPVQAPVEAAPATYPGDTSIAFAPAGGADVAAPAAE